MSTPAKRAITVVAAVFLLLIVGAILISARRPDFNIRQMALNLLSPTPAATASPSPSPNGTANRGLNVIQEASPSGEEENGTSSTTENEEDFTGTGGIILPVTVVFTAQNDDGIAGTATLQDQEGRTVVTIAMTGTQRGSAMTSGIYSGSCPSVGAARYTLNPIVNGRSQTILNVGLEELNNQQPLAMAIRQTTGRTVTTAACGDIPNITQ